jgi:hypothetical protein
VVFQRDIRSTCQLVLERRLEDYGQALGVNLREYGIKPYIIP